MSKQNYTMPCSTPIADDMIPGGWLSPGEEYHALPQPEIKYLHCEYCKCNVDTAPTCSQCGAPLKNPALDAPLGYMTWKV